MDRTAQLKAARAHFEARQYDRTENILLGLHAFGGGDHESYFLLGQTLQRLQRLEDSVTALSKSGELLASAPCLNLLANVQARLGRLDQAGETLRRLVALKPRLMSARLSLVFNLQKTGQTAEALAVLEGASQLAPEDPDIALAHANAILDTDEKGAIAQLERFHRRIETDAAKSSFVLRRLTEIRDTVNRRLLGLPPSHARSWDLMWKWHDEPGAVALARSLDRERQSSHVRSMALVDQGCIALTTLAWARAEECFALLRNNPSERISDVVTFDDELFRRIENLTDDQIAFNLPPVEHILSSNALEGPSIFLPCDPVYFERFAVTLIHNLDACAPRLHIHVHFMDGDPATWSRALTKVSAANVVLTATGERSAARETNPEKAGEYYVAVRWIRFYQYLLSARRPTWSLDVDVDVTRDPQPMLGRLNDYDLAIRGYSGVLEPWSKVAGYMVGVSPTQTGMRFAKFAAAYIAFWMQQGRLRWMMDQLALFCAVAMLHRHQQEPKILYIDETMGSEIGNESEATFHFKTGFRKFSN